MRILRHTSYPLSQQQQADLNSPASTKKIEQAILRELVQAGLLDDFVAAPAVGSSHAASATAATRRVDNVSATQQLGASELGRAAQSIQAERERTEREKYTFTPKQRMDVAAFNTKREIKNAKLRGEVAELELQMQHVTVDPKLSPAKRSKKLRKLLEKRQKVQSKLKPPVVLEKVTAEIDAIASDNRLTQKQKKKKLEKLRKQYDIPEDKGFLGHNGPVNMHDMFTGRIGKIYKASRRRIDQTAKAHKNELRANLAALKESRCDSAR